jgi:hypothetical protein
MEFHERTVPDKEAIGIVGVLTVSGEEEEDLVPLNTAYTEYCTDTPGACLSIANVLRSPDAIDSPEPSTIV